jgi:CRP-like cAMP-binding protein
MTKLPHIDCASCPHRALNAFAGLTTAELEEIDREKVTQEYRHGEILYREGAPALAAYCIHSGWVEICVIGETGRTQGIRLIGAGGLLGYQGILSDRSYTTTSKVVADSSVCLIQKSTFLRFVYGSGPFAEILLKQLANDFSILVHQLTNVAQYSVRRRLATSLLNAFALPGGSPAMTGGLAIPLMRTDLAELAGTTPETCSRELAQMAEEGVVKLTRTAVMVSNLPALRKIAGVVTS